MMNADASAAPLPNDRCPVCGAPNACAPAGSGSFANACWCTTVTIDPAALAAVPEAWRGRACLCQRCATQRPGASPAA